MSLVLLCLAARLTTVSLDIAKQKQPGAVKKGAAKGGEEEEYDRLVNRPRGITEEKE